MVLIVKKKCAINQFNKGSPLLLVLFLFLLPLISVIVCISYLQLPLTEASEATASEGVQLNVQLAYCQKTTVHRSYVNTKKSGCFPPNAHQALKVSMEFRKFLTPFLSLKLTSALKYPRGSRVLILKYSQWNRVLWGWTKIKFISTYFQPGRMIQEVKYSRF